MRDIAANHADAIERGFPKLLRRVGGYNLDTVEPAGHNLASLLVGSEGSLATFTRLELDLHPIPPHRVLGICHFPTFRRAMEATRHIVSLSPTAVELVDRTLLDLSRGIAMFRPVAERFVRGDPEALLLVEFAGEDHAEQQRGLARLVERLGDLGLPEAVVKVTEPADQSAVWELRKAGLNIVMSMKGDGKPVSFIEDCAVRLEDLPDYTERLDSIFERHGTTGTWYAHASVGCLHVRPILNLKEEADVRKMRAIAEEAFAMVREYRGSHSGEHGDGLVRSEFHEAMFGREVVRAFEEVKDAFDPEGRLNPGKIVRSPRMDDRSLFRYPPGYRTRRIDTILDWSEWRGFAGAVEMCNNNGACRKLEPGVMCPSFRATGDEQHLTRGRANTLRLALSGRLGADGFTSDAVAEALDLCVGCKGCKRECPTGVDMARMKIEFLHHRRRRHGLPLRERIVAWLPRYAPIAARAPALLNARDRSPLLARLSERWLGFSARRPLPRWRRDPFRPRSEIAAAAPRGERSGRAGQEVVLFADTFTRWFEPGIPRAAVRILRSAGCRVRTAGSGPAAAVLRSNLSHERTSPGSPCRGAPDPRRPPPVRRARGSRSSGSNRRASTPSATRSRPSSPARRVARSRSTRCCSRNGSRASGTAAPFGSRSGRSRSGASSCTPTAIRRRSGPERRRETCSDSFRASRSRTSNRAAAEWRVRSATRRSTSTSRCGWEKCRSCRPSGPPRPAPGSSRAGRAAGARSPTAPPATPPIRPKCWPRRSRNESERLLRAAAGRVKAR